MPIYLDYNASAPIDSRVLERIIDIYKNASGNADSRTHTFGTKAKEIVAKSRLELAQILSVDPSDFLFTSGATESNNIVILGLLEYALSSGRNHFITTSIEHKSVLEPMKQIAKRGIVVDFINPDSSGRICVNDVTNRITDKTLLVSVMHVNSETGIIQPVDELGEALAKTKTYFHVDATQSFGKMNDEIRKLKYDFLSFSGHKLSGPQGIGGLLIKKGTDYKRPPLTPLFYGGPQERGFRPGTTPVALVGGLAYAAQLKENEFKENNISCMKTKQSLIETIKDLKYEINGDPKFCIPSTINISFSGVDAESVFVALKDQYALSNGSACTSGSYAPSYVLTAMGLDETRIASALRISWDGGTKVDFSRLVHYIKSVL